MEIIREELSMVGKREAQEGSQMCQQSNLVVLLHF